MKKVMFFELVAVCLIIVFSTAFHNEAVAETKPIKWKMSTTWTSGNDYSTHDKYFVKIVNEMSGGRLQIEYFPTGAIVPPTQIFETVQNNVLQAGGDWPGFWIGRDSAFNILAGFPMAPGPYDYQSWIYANGGLEVYNELYGKFGLVYFPHYAMGPESGILGRKGTKKLKSIEDFKGIKIRMAGKLQSYILKELGAAPVNITPDEIYQSLERGLLDYAEYSMPHSDWSLGLQDVTKEWNVPCWFQSGFVVGVMINKQAYEKLPKDLQAIVRYAAQATMLWSSGRGAILAGQYTTKFLEKGMQVNVLDEESLSRIADMAYKGLLIEAQANPTFAKAAYLLFKSAAESTPFRVVGDDLLLKMKRKQPDMEAFKKAAGQSLLQQKAAGPVLLQVR